MSRVNPFIYLYIGVALLVCERGGILGMSPLPPPPPCLSTLPSPISWKTITSLCVGTCRCWFHSSFPSFFHFISSSFPQFHHCCSSPKLASSIIIINQTITKQYCWGTTAMMKLRKWRSGRFIKQNKNSEHATHFLADFSFGFAPLTLSNVIGMAIAKSIVASTVMALWLWFHQKYPSHLEAQ